MNPHNYVHSIYTKDNAIKYVAGADSWVPTYLNKVLIQDKRNAEALSKIIPYCFYVSPTQYFYLLYMLIPYNLNYSYSSTKKAKEPEEDKLVEKLKHVLGWSTREYNLNKKQIEATILSDRETWESNLGVQNERPKRTRK